jgi:arylsulfatase
LFVDGRQVAQGRIPQMIAVRFSLAETFDVGADMGTPVVEDYADNENFQRIVELFEPRDEIISLDK